jgi:NADH:ubiquinone oxidoreductase subunit 3 (subunit A)
MYDGWFSVAMFLLVGLLAAILFLILRSRLAPKKRRGKRGRDRRTDRIDLVSGAKE